MGPTSCRFTDISLSKKFDHDCGALTSPVRKRDEEEAALVDCGGLLQVFTADFVIWRSPIEFLERQK